MLHLRKTFSTLWPAADREGDREGSPGAEGEIEEIQNNDNSSPPVTIIANGAPVDVTAASNEAGTTVVNGSHDTISTGHNLDDSRRGEERQREERHAEQQQKQQQPQNRPRVLRRLAHPWGSSDAVPPTNWSSKSSSAVPSEPYQGRRRLHEDAFRDTDDDDDNDDADNLATAIVPITLGGAWGLDHMRTSTKRQRGDDPDMYAMFTADINNSLKNLNINGGNTGLALQQQQQQQQPRGQQRRTCPADSTFISPVKRRILSHSEKHAKPSEEEETHVRAFPPSHLIFRAGFFKALAGRRSASATSRRFAGRPPVTTISKTTTITTTNGGINNGPSIRLRRRTGEMHALLVRHAFHAAYPSYTPEKQDGEQGQAGVMVIAGVAGGRKGRDGGEGDDEVRERVNRTEMEKSVQADRIAEARLRRLETM